MLTDRPPSKATIRARFIESDRLRTLEVPKDDRLQAAAKSIASAMQGGTASSVRQACAEFLSAASSFYTVRPPGIRVLAARPLRVREGGSAIELFGITIPKPYSSVSGCGPPSGNKSPRSARSSAHSATSSAITSIASASGFASRGIHAAFTSVLLRSTTTHVALQ